jgi:hypothetical protein
MNEEFDLSGLKGAMGVGDAKMAVPGGSMNPDLAVALGKVKDAYKTQFGKDLPITSGGRTRDEQQKLYDDWKAGKPGIYQPLNPANYPDQKTFHSDAVDIPASVPESLLNAHGIHRPLGAKDPVHAVLMQPTKQQTITTSAAPANEAAQTGDFDLGGLKSAMGLGGSESAQPNQPAAPAPAPATTKQPEIKRMFEPKSELDRKIMNFIEEIPGSKELGAFGNAAAGTVSKSVSSIAQLIGQYFPGLSNETRERIAKAEQKNIQQVNKALAPSQEQYPKSSLAGEVTGFVFNPINKVIPGGPAAQSLTGAVTKSALQGAAANVLTTPVENLEKPFTTQKIEQGVTGAAFGGAFGGALHLTANALSKGIQSVRQQFGNMVPSNQLDDAAAKVMAEAGIDSTKVNPEFFKSLQDQAKNAIQTGDVKGFQKYATNYMEANSLAVPVPLLRGQLTRDPMQYAIEQNLRGVERVGEPIQAILQKQNSALIQNLDALGASKGADVISSGSTLKNALKKADQAEAQKVRDAYDAFKNSTGKNVDVPLQGVAQDYAKVLHDFGDTVPSGVRNNFESLGLLKGTQTKVTTIEDAENLIKVINKNYDKSNPAQRNALDELRRSVNNAINDAGKNLPGEAGAVAREARAAAEKRFNTIESIPALRDVLKGKEPDKFVQNHILQGNVAEIEKMTKFLQANNPEALAQMQNDVMRLIKNRVTNNVSDANAKFSQAQLKEFLSDTTGERLKRFLSPEQINGLKQLNRVAENALVEPVASAVNKSNTAAQAANLVKGTINTGAVNELLTRIADIKFPGVSMGATTLRQMNQGRLASGMVEQAVNPAALPPPKPISTMVKPGVAGAGAGTATINQRNREFERQQ